MYVNKKIETEKKKLRQANIYYSIRFFTSIMPMKLFNFNQAIRSSAKVSLHLIDVHFFKLVRWLFLEVVICDSGGLAARQNYSKFKI